MKSIEEIGAARGPAWDAAVAAWNKAGEAMEAAIVALDAANSDRLEAWQKLKALEAAENTL